MRLIKLLGIVAVAITAAVVIIGPSSASSEEETEDSEIVMCKHKALLLCHPELIWPEGKGVTGLSDHFLILGSKPVLCKNLVWQGPVTPAMAPALQWTFTGSVINQCEGGCTIAIEELSPGEISASPGDNYLLLLKMKLKATCPDSTCTYNGHTTIPIDEPDTSGKPILLAKDEPLTASGTGCGTTAKWDATIEMVGGALTIYFSLFELKA